MKFILPEFSDLTFEQKNLVAINLDVPERNWWRGNLVVKGYGGTWKTVVACHRALKLLNQKKKVLFLCFWKALKDFLSTAHFKYEILYFQDFYNKIRSSLIASFDSESLEDGRMCIKSKRDMIQYEGGHFYKERFSKNFYDVSWDIPYGMTRDYIYIKYQRNTYKVSETIKREWFFANDQSEEFLSLLFGWYKEEKCWWSYPYDEIFIDEAQDISPAMFRALKILAPHFSIFADENQRIIWDEWSWSSMSQIANIFFPNMTYPEDQIVELTINKRSTREICEYAAEYFLPENESVKLLTQGRDVQSIPDSYPEEFTIEDPVWRKRKIATLVKLAQKRWNATTIFVAKISDVDDISSFLTKEEIPHWKYHNKIKHEKGENVFKVNQNVFVSTFKSSKGLESDCVILIVDRKEYSEYIEAGEWSRKNNIFYVLATRAKRKLYIIFTFKE